MKILRYFLLLFFFTTYFASSQDEFVKIKPKSGDGVYTILRRYLLPVTDESIQSFNDLNNGKFTKKGNLMLHHEYAIPVKIYNFNGKTIRSTIGVNDYDYAKNVEEYNLKLWKLGLKKDDYRVSKILWVPIFQSSMIFDTKEPPVEALKEIAPEEVKKNENPKSDNVINPYFGKAYSEIKAVDKKLQGYVYYLVAGHGGPDPGAIGTKSGYSLHEDEYAYDVTLRLAKRLLEHSATVYVIVQDPDDGIRDDYYLKGDFHEFYYGGDTIALNQLNRLQKRAQIINNLYYKNKATAKDQFTIVTHVDSRVTDKRIDIFFYHNPGNVIGESLSNILLETIESKYAQAQPGRGYEGTSNPRHLYMLKKTIPTAVYIELGNIQNPRDQIRIIEPNNRQAIANWLCDGLIKAIESK